MNLRDPDTVEKLAAEYVLGTLRGPARHRFQRLAQSRRDVREAIWRWEGRLAGLFPPGAELAPPAAAWAGIEARIWGQPSHRPGLWRSLGFWRGWSAAATAAALVLALWLVPLPPSQERPDHVGIIGDGASPQWMVSANLETGRLDVRAVNAEAAAVEKAFELWMLPEAGPPRSIGLLPVSGESMTRTLPPALLALLRESKGLAVSIEPAGGSPTGLPTGPVIHTSSMLAL